MNFKMLCAIFSLMSISTAFAQANQFEGFALSAGMGPESVTTQFQQTGNAGANLNDTYNLGKVSLVENIDASYAKALDPNWILGGGASYIFNQVDGGSISSIDSNRVFYNYGYKLKNPLSLYIEPGYALDESSLMFAKISYEIATLNIFDIHGQIISSPSNYEDNVNLCGYGIAIGYKKLLHDHLFFVLEEKYISYGYVSSDAMNSYNNRTSNSSKVHNLLSLLNLGYRF